MIEFNCCISCEIGDREFGCLVLVVFFHLWVCVLVLNWGEKEFCLLKISMLILLRCFEWSICCNKTFGVRESILFEWLKSFSDLIFLRRFVCVLCQSAVGFHCTALSLTFVSYFMLLAWRKCRRLLLFFDWVLWRAVANWLFFIFLLVSFICFEISWLKGRGNTSLAKG